MLLLDVDGILDLLISEQLVARDFGHLIDWLLVVFLIETLLIR